MNRKKNIKAQIGIAEIRHRDTYIINYSSEDELTGSNNFLILQI